LPQSAAGQAVHYLLKNWAALTRYCDNPALSIDNNHTERSLCGWAIGRNNWTFFGSDRGGKTAAVLRSFVASCELIEVHPFAWFHDVLSCIADYPMTRLDEFLPHRWSPTNLNLWIPPVGFIERRLWVGIAVRLRSINPLTTNVFVVFLILTIVPMASSAASAISSR
jgi:hypothetical protein